MPSPGCASSCGLLLCGMHNDPVDHAFRRLFGLTWDACSPLCLSRVLRGGHADHWPFRAVNCGSGWPWRFDWFGKDGLPADFCSNRRWRHCRRRSVVLGRRPLEGQDSLLLAVLAIPASLAGVAFVPLLKALLHRARPMEMYQGTDGFSFPSGHSTFATTCSFELSSPHYPDIPGDLQICKPQQASRCS